MNHQLPGRVSPRWFRTVLTVLATAVATVWILALLPFLLLAALVLALLMVPALRRLRNEIQIHHDNNGLSPRDLRCLKMKMKMNEQLGTKLLAIAFEH